MKGAGGGGGILNTVDCASVLRQDQIYLYMLALHCLICNVVLVCEGLHACSLAFSKLLTVSLIHPVYTLNAALLQQ